MNKTIIHIVLFLSFFITFTACAKKPQEPYFDRAKSASQQAHNELKRD
ncbi:MAG: hypothetical protein ACI9TV_002557 [Sulfurimonas sp.]|jgi:hypothetical protein